MIFKTTILLTIISILAIYSVEISFMPNYIHRPDKWHLLYPMLGFYFILFAEYVWITITMIKQKKFFWYYIVILSSILICFLNLNNPKNNSQEIGYVGLILLLIIFTGNLFLKRKPNDA
ncbi:cell division protein FtsW (lipid II flippase) [Aureibacter tunicatorum]|uniref:Cell division protein FtsW (Lipid II flippase) n=1 Tax=Aureibacter tunicatorum TaxID=866807 RepID=A0AAE4BRB2_9BACT|nr:cell division protein FtsW (lipid II flippase) [Aureibacter tunicatorum]BDD05586.1 hypothetical protein AUTU_30690 [Aureibacter tunicatorum]